MLITNFHFTAILGLCASLTLAAPVQPGPSRALTPPPPAGQQPVAPVQPGPAQATTPPPATVQPAAAKNIVLGGVTYGLLKEQRGPVSSTWSLSDPSLVARQFKTTDPERKKAFDLIRQRIIDIGTTNFRIPRMVQGNLALFGKSQINGQGEDFSWVLEHGYTGKGLRQHAVWDEMLETGRQACKTFLRQTVAIKLTQKLLGFYEQTGLIHLSPDEHNTKWSDGAKSLLGFVGQEHLYTSESVEFKKIMTELWPGQPTTNVRPAQIRVAIKLFSEKVRNDLYPDSWCPLAGKIIKKHKIGDVGVSQNMPRPSKKRKV